ncbi:MAG: aspartate aminotransferase family protein, partial [Candidatus Bathyarchaeia archaeon]
TNLNSQLLETINQTGKAFLSHTTLKGKYVIRFCIAQRTTQEEHVKRTWKLVTEKAEELLKQQ